MSSSRSTSYSIEEDKRLCHIYLDISQNPIIGINQSKDRLWERITDAYNSFDSSYMQERGLRSLESRMSIIMAAVAKLNGCVKQIENMNPSGASDEDILNRANELLLQDPKYKKGFKFDHVWPILKGIEKFNNINSRASPSVRFESSPSVSTGMNLFDLNMDDMKTGVNFTQRPVGVKKSKALKKNEDQLNKLVDHGKELVEAIRKGNHDRDENMKLKLKNEKYRIEVAEMKEENKIMYTDLNSISNLVSRQFIEGEQRRILKKRQEAWHEEEGLGSQYQESQYRTSQVEEAQRQLSDDQGEGCQNQGQEYQDPSQDFSQYYNYLSGTGNNFSEN